jgi:hypothetical protein
MPNEKIDLAALEKRLNSSAGTRKAFLEDPVAALKKEGMNLTPEMQRSVGYLVDRLKKPGRLVPGAGISPADLRAITITIGVDF